MDSGIAIAVYWFSSRALKIVSFINPVNLQRPFTCNISGAPFVTFTESAYDTCLLRSGYVAGWDSIQRLQSTTDVCPMPFLIPRAHLCPSAFN